MKKDVFLGNTGGHSMFDKFSYSLEKSSKSTGVISNNEFLNATFTQHYRTIEEFSKPFDDPNSISF